MNLVRARVIKADRAPEGATRLTAGSIRGARTIPQAVATAGERARQILARAERDAEGIRAQATRDAANTLLRAEEVGRAEAAAALAARSVALAQAEATLDERHLERTTAIAKLLAERLLGRALDLDPALIASIAHEALAEIRGARRVRLAAHPEAAAALRSVISDLALSDSVLAVVDDAELERGDLRIETELGSLDARLGLRLDRLARHLREALGR